MAPSIMFREAQHAPSWAGSPAASASARKTQDPDGPLIPGVVECRASYKILT